MTKYNPEIVQSLAQQIANLMAAKVEQGQHIGDIEQAMRGLLQEIGQQSLQMVLEEEEKAKKRKQPHRKKRQR